jgi:hypothetical protein
VVNGDDGWFGVLGGPGGDLLSRALRHSTMGAAGFHGRVREGIGWFTRAMTTRSTEHPFAPASRPVETILGTDAGGMGGEVVLPLDRRSSFERLGSVSCVRCRTSTSDLSTWWSTTALKRDLVLRWVSRLDAFSGYPVRT